MKRTRWLVMLLSLCCLSPIFTRAQVPALVNYQGVLFGSDKNPVASDYYEMEFRVWGAATGTNNLLWGEVNRAYVASGGVFNVLLGSGNTNGLAAPDHASVTSLLDAFSGEPRYLGLTVTKKNGAGLPSPTEIAPRQQLCSAPYAIQAKGTVPVGGIIMWSGAINTIPVGWALCDGTKDTPNLTDRFIVGAGGAYPVSNTGGLATVTLATNQMPAHGHLITDPGHVHSYVYDNVYKHEDTSRTFEDEYLVRVDTDQTNTTGSGTTGITMQNAGGGLAHENRPPYYALAYIMRVK